MNLLKRLTGAAICWSLLATLAMAQDKLADTSTAQCGLAAIDWLLIAGYCLGTIALGAWFGRKQQSTEEYFTGSGHMNPVLIGVSLFATLLSTISYMSMPGEALGKGPAYLTSLLAYPMVYLIVGYGIIPIFMKHRVTSAYELLEERLGIEIRVLGAVMFILLRLVWMSLLVYLTAKALVIMMGLDEKWIPLIALIAGFVAVIYTSIGGLQAVVVTDLLQTILLFGGAVLVIVTISIDLGGFAWFPTEWDPNWDVQPLLPINPETGAFDVGIRVSILGAVLSFLVWYVCTSAGDQTSVQRFMATTDARAARRALAIQLTVSVVVAITLSVVGFALLGYFRANPTEIPVGLDLKANADRFFPHFIAFHLPVGISGLVVSAMFAAAMSSIDSGVNSITAVVMTDFVDRFRGKPVSEKQHVWLARILAFGIGAVVVIGSAFMEHVPGNITSVTQKTSNLLTTPIFCLFFFALFVPFATRIGVLAGAFAGTFVAVRIAFSGPIFGFIPGPTPGSQLDPISFQWIAPAAVAVNIAVGLLVSIMMRILGRDIRDILNEKP